jgi:hypothetical protein
MARTICMFILATLLVPIGCEQKPADRTPGKVTPEDVRRDARQAAKTAGEYSRQTADEIRKDFESPSPGRTPERATSEKLRRDAADAVKAAKEYSKKTKDEVLKELEPQPARRTSDRVASKEVRRDVSEAAVAASESAKLAKSEFQKKLEAQLDELDGKITVLREKRRNLKDSAKADWDQKMAELDVKRDAARAKLAKVARASVEAWNDVKREAELAWDDLENAFRDTSK